MFKVIVNDGKNPIPDEDGISYLVGKNGIFVRKKLGLINSLTKVDKISFLKDIEPFVEITIPKIPAIEFEKTVKFFREIYNKYSSEAMVLIAMKNDDSEIKVFAPKQEVAGASMTYEPINLDGYYLVGTIHSHGSMGAFHSGVDIDDENDFDGLHITIGNVNSKDKFSVSVEAVVNGYREKVAPSKYIEGIKHFQIDKKEIVAQQKTLFNRLMAFSPFVKNKDTYITEKLKQNYHTIKYESSHYYQLENELLPVDWKCDEWIENVKKKVYVRKPYISITSPHAGRVVNKNYPYPYVNRQGFGYDEMWMDMWGWDDKSKTEDKNEEKAKIVTEDKTLLQSLLEEYGFETSPCYNCKHAEDIEFIITDVLDSSYSESDGLDSNDEFDLIDYDKDDASIEVTGDDPRILKEILKNEREV